VVGGFAYSVWLGCGVISPIPRGGWRVSWKTETSCGKAASEVLAKLFRRPNFSFGVLPSPEPPRMAFSQPPDSSNMLASPPPTENLDSPGSNNITNNASNDGPSTNPRPTQTPLHNNNNHPNHPSNPHHHHHHSRSNSAARRSIPVAQGQTPSTLNGNSTSNAMPTAMPSKQQPPGIPMGPGVPPFDSSRSPPGSKSKFIPV
jgi:hypothetical protein